MYQSTLIIVLFRFFLAAFLVGTIGLVIRLIKNYKTLAAAPSLSLDESRLQAENRRPSKSRVVFKSAAVVFLWFIFSLYIFALDLANSVGDSLGAAPMVEADARTLGIIGAHLLWFLAGLLLIYWAGKMPRNAGLR